MSCKALCSQLCSWALAGLKLYQMLHWKGGAMLLVDDFPLSVYSSGKDTLELALIIEAERIFAALEQPGDVDLDAFKAIATVGSKFPERTLKTLAGSLIRRKWSGHALEAIKGVWSPDDEIAAKLDKEIPSFFREGSIRRQHPLEALEYLGPGHPRLLVRAATGLLAGGVGQIEDRQFCLQMFERLHGQSDPSLVVESLGKALFHPAMSRQSVHEDRLSENLKFLLKAFEAAAERDYTSAVHSIMEHLNPSEDAWVRAIAAYTAQHFAAKEDERLVEAFQNCLDERLTGKMYLRRVALSFNEISSSANPFISPLCAELTGRDAPEVLATIKTINPVDNESALMALMSHLGSGCSLDDLLKVVALVDQVAQSDRSYVSHANALLMEALASLAARGRSRAASLLLETAEAHGGASDAVLVKLVQETLLKIKKSDDSNANELLQELFNVIHERFSVQACCTAIRAMSMASPEQMANFVTPQLLELLAVEKDCALKCALLETLQREKSMPTEISQIGQQLLFSDPVETVRLYSLRLLSENCETVDVQILLQCIASDPSFSVCQLAFEILNALPSEQIDTAEIASVLRGALLHRDGQIRSSAIEALSKMTRQGRTVALAALSCSEPWPELDLDIRKKRQDAIATLMHSRDE